MQIFDCICVCLFHLLGTEWTLTSDVLTLWMNYWTYNSLNKTCVSRKVHAERQRSNQNLQSCSSSLFLGNALTEPTLIEIMSYFAHIYTWKVYNEEAVRSLVAIPRISNDMMSFSIFTIIALKRKNKNKKAASQTRDANNHSKNGGLWCERCAPPASKQWQQAYCYVTHIFILWAD